MIETCRWRRRTSRETSNLTILNSTVDMTCEGAKRTNESDAYRLAGAETFARCTAQLDVFRESMPTSTQYASSALS